MTSLPFTCRWFPVRVHKFNDNNRVHIAVSSAFTLNNVLFVKIFNNGCYNIIYHSFLVISRQISILKWNILTNIKMNFDEVLLKPFRITVFCVIRHRKLDGSCVR